jgi:two-component system, LytTR family, sensor kinase
MLPSSLTWMESSLPLPGQTLPACETASSNGVVSSQPLPSAAPTGKPYWVALPVFIIWTLISLCTAAQYYFFHDPNDGPPLSWIRALGLGFSLWYSWGLLGLLAFRLLRRFPLETRHWPSRLLVHMAAAATFAAVKLVIDYPIIKGLYCPRPETLTFSLFLYLGMCGPFLRYILYYWAMIAVVDYYGKYRDGQLQAAQLEAGLTRARLQLLKSQLQPHFLFNTLNAISALLHVDVEAADRMLARLGDLLRLALEDFGVQEAPLARELEVARSYLEIEQARLGPRLRVHWHIAPDLGDALVPTFLLQPLIENAVHHGIAPRCEGGRIDIHIHREGSQLHVEVRDDGPGLAAGGTATGGVGLTNTRARLLQLYGTNQRLEVTNGWPCGCVARVLLPFRELAAEPATT